MDQRKRQLQAEDNARQVAVLAVRYRGDRFEVCLIRRKDSGDWGIPKGFIDPGSSPEQAALNEALEEAGVKGQLAGDSLGTYDYKKRGRPLTVTVYLMEVLEELEHWREARLRERSWRPPEEAASLLASHPVRALWDGVRQALTALRERRR